MVNKGLHALVALTGAAAPVGAMGDHVLHQFGPAGQRGGRHLHGDSGFALVDVHRGIGVKRGPCRDLRFGRAQRPCKRQLPALPCRCGGKFGQRRIGTGVDHASHGFHAGKSGLAKGVFHHATKASARFRSTETSWLTPCSAIVTPNKRSIRAIVTPWWVMIRNRVSVRRVISSSRSQNRVTLASSRGASTPSSTQIGAGLARNTPKISARAVRVCSPPDKSDRVDRRFPGGWHMISRPASSGSSDSTSTRRASPPPKRWVNRVPKLALTCSKAVNKRSRPSLFRPAMPERSFLIASSRSPFSLARVSY